MCVTGADSMLRLKVNETMDCLTIEKGLVQGVGFPRMLCLPLQPIGTSHQCRAQNCAKEQYYTDNANAHFIH